MAKRVERDIIALVGRINTGKSSLLNLLSGQKDYAIVDATPGTTTDTVAAVMEIHDLGPVKLLDTAGVDEFTALGNKKRKKTYEAIEEADLNLIVIEMKRAAKEDLSIERNLIEHIKEYNKQALVIYNVFGNPSIKTIKRNQLLADKNLNCGLPSIVLNATNLNHQHKFIEFIKNFYQKKRHLMDLLPTIRKNGYVLLVVPMDEETPALRLLRPQDMAVERLLRDFVTPVLFRPDLGRARHKNPKIAKAEKTRFLNLLNYLASSKEGLRLVVTDSQAFDVISRWTPEHIPFTSFSIMMTNFMSGGNLKLFIEGVKTVDALQDKDSILIVEACNHDRKCDDIGTVQIPRLIRKKTGKKLCFKFNFGRVFPDNLSPYRLIVHCGACMIDRQKYLRRIFMAEKTGTPITNYGILLSYLRGKKVLKKAVKPFGTGSL